MEHMYAKYPVEHPRRPTIQESVTFYSKTAQSVMKLSSKYKSNTP